MSTTTINIDDRRPVPAATAESHGILLPPSGKFRNSGILLPGELWTLKSDEFSLVKVTASLRAILERGDGSPSGN